MQVRHKVVLSVAIAATLTGGAAILNNHRAGPDALYPNSALTPGTIDTDITQANITLNICNPNWSTKSIRPSSGYTTALKIKQIQQYGFTDTATKDYEEDHLISLELGGNPTDPNNLWPESYAVPGAHDKDKVENYLHAQVCAGTMSLQEAQHDISTDWYAVFQQMNKQPTYGSVGSTSDVDDETLQ